MNDNEPSIAKQIDTSIHADKRISLLPDISTYRQQVEDVLTQNLAAVADPVEFTFACDSALRAIDPTLRTLERDVVIKQFQINKDFTMHSPDIMRVLSEHDISIDSLLKIGKAANTLVDLDLLLVDNYVRRVGGSEDSDLAAEFPGIDQALAKRLKAEHITIEEHLTHAGVPIHIGNGVNKESIMHLLAVISATGQDPDPRYITAITFVTNTHDPAPALFVRHMKSILMQLPIHTAHDADSIIPEALSSYVHEKRHAKQPYLFNIILELDACITVVNTWEHILSEYKTHQELQHLFPDPDYIEAAHEDAKGLLEDILQKLADPDVQVQLHADHTIEQSRQRHDTRLEHTNTPTALQEIVA